VKNLAENLLLQWQTTPSPALSPAQMFEPGRATEEAGAGFCGERRSFNLTDL